MVTELYELGKSKYEHATGLDEMERDKKGFIILKPSAKHIDRKSEALTTDIGLLEMKLKQFKDEKAKTEAYKKTEDYKRSAKNLSKKKKKKQKETLINMIFNNADNAEEEIDEEALKEQGGSYVDKKGKKKAPSKKVENTLDTTYGMRFSPIVAMIQDTIFQFDKIANDIEEELKKSGSQAKTMYKSSQTSNLISATNNKFQAVKELATIAKTVSDLEYKQKKDKQSEEGSDNTKAIASLGAKFLRGGLLDDDDDDDYSYSSGKKGKKDKGKKSDKKRRFSLDDDSDDDDEEDSIREIGSSKKRDKDKDNKELAEAFASRLLKEKDNIKLTPHEKFIRMEGKYKIYIACDPSDPDKDWKFIAINPDSGKEIKNFKDDYPGLIPRKKDCRIVFDLTKNRAVDKISAKSYPLMYFDK